MSASPQHRDNLSTPWQETSITPPPVHPTNLRDLPVALVGRSQGRQRLVYPWSTRGVPVPVRQPVSFSSLAAPTAPVRLPAPRPAGTDQAPVQA